MHYFPAALQDLADQFARLPGIGGKTAQRLAFHVLGLPLADAQAFADAIVNAKQSVHTCPVCQNLTDKEICGICSDDLRDQGIPRFQSFVLGLECLILHQDCLNVI